MNLFIPNRDNGNISVLVEGHDQPGKLAFVMHGLGGNKEQGHIRAIAEAFLENDYTVVTWDAVHSFGKSTGGSYEDATITNYFEDLEDVVDWAATQPWYVEPFVLAGHSLGGIGTILFTQKNPQKVRALAPVSAVVSGKLSLQTNADDFKTWERDGIRITKSHDGKREKRLKWSHMEDRMRYDVLPQGSQITIPVLLIVGEADNVTPPNHQQLLFKELSGPKELHIIRGALHSFYESHEQTELKAIVKAWLAKIDHMAH